MFDLSISSAEFKYKKFIENNLLKIFIIVIIIGLFTISLYYYLDRYRNIYIQEKLKENIEMLNLILEEKMTRMSGYAMAVARYRGLMDIENNNLLKRRIFNLDSQLEVRGIEVYNNNTDLVFKTGSSFDVVKYDNLSESILEVIEEGYTLSFFSDNDLFEIQINAVSPIYDEYSIDTSGFVIVSDVILKEDLQVVANKIDGLIEFFKVDEIKDNDEKMFINSGRFKGRSYYIRRKEINDLSYLIGYLPVRGFYNNIIGYITLFKPQDNTVNFIYKLILLSLLYTFIIIYVVSLVLHKLF